MPVTHRPAFATGLTSLQAATSPEITRTDMTTPTLQLRLLGIDDLMKFKWISTPPAGSILHALETLVTSGRMVN